MSDPENRPKRVRLTKPKLSKEAEKYGDMWLRQLRQLPKLVLDECVARLLYGETDKQVTLWLVVQPDRGGLFLFADHPGVGDLNSREALFSSTGN